MQESSFVVASPTDDQRPAWGWVWVVALSAIALAVAALVLRARNAAIEPDVGELYLTDVWVSVTLPPVGAYLLTRSRARLLGLLLLSTALLALGSAGAMWAVHLHLTRADPGLVASAAAWPATWSWGPYLLLLTAVPFLVPTGRPASAGWGTVVAAAVGAVAALMALASLTPGRIEPYQHLTNPLGLEGAGWLVDGGQVLVGGTVAVFVLLGLVSAIGRWRRGRAEDRRRLGWSFAALVLLSVTVLGAGDLPYPWIDIVPAIGITVLVAAIVASALSSETAEEARHVREQLTVAREDERFRVHRDLHDGLGPELAGLALHLNAIGSNVADEPTRRQLGIAEDALRRTVEEVRRIVDDLRPPDLDQLGLPGALHERAASLSQVSGLHIEVHDDPSIGTLPPAMEVAIYRIGCEAMTNVVRHAGATRCVVRLGRDGTDVRLEIEDDGRGLRADDVPGIGTASMQARADELGGRLQRRPGTGGRGTNVTAVLPEELGP